MVDVTTVRSIQPHIGRGTMTVISNWPPRYSDAGSLVAMVFLDHEKLQTYQSQSLELRSKDIKY